MKKWLLIMISTLFLFGFFVIYSTLFEPSMIEIVRKEIKLENLPPLAEEVVFVQISDIHFRKFGLQEKNLLQKLKEVSPDYLFITGDLVDWTTRPTSQLEKFLETLKKIPKKEIFLVYGNHEHRNRFLKKIETLFEKYNFQIINNKNLLLEEGIYLIGLDDPHLGFDKIEKATKEVNLKKPKILLAHSPEIFRKIKFKNVLVLTGHTHGGQINLPFISDLILPLKGDKKYKRGLYQNQGKWLYVNRGIGWTFLPLRFRARPEITIITLRND